jgi:hypothetical protein
MQLQPIVAEELRTRLTRWCCLFVSIIKSTIVRLIQILRAGQPSDLVTCDVIESKKSESPWRLIRKASEFNSAFSRMILMIDDSR